ncbi:hypothetical protein SAMN05660666_02124 [Novosphingobium aromaticivorans]|uniref:hypothetical protein n=1 Tax=Novosphingobium aromaticivorans TaxID=48935 RepID=UPI000038A6C1|nr:hypothetical protein [Novosphingobium aromaticivorans]SCY58488.1 hypothetical protein SAMN05660666_02124 [Novosphingobium aromaticivorans]
MHAAATTLDEVFDALSGALDELDRHGEAMAALHLAMAVDCLRNSLAPECPPVTSVDGEPRLRLVFSRG